MFGFGKKSSGGIGLWNESQFARKLGLSSMKFKKILAIEVERYTNSKLKNYGRDYKFTPDEKKYGGIPTSDGFHDKRQKFNNKSADHIIKLYGSKFGITFNKEG